MLEREEGSAHLFRFVLPEMQRVLDDALIMFDIYDLSYLEKQVDQHNQIVDNHLGDEAYSFCRYALIEYKVKKQGRTYQYYGLAFLEPTESPGSRTIDASTAQRIRQFYSSVYSELSNGRLHVGYCNQLPNTTAVIVIEGSDPQNPDKQCFEQYDLSKYKLEAVINHARRLQASQLDIMLVLSHDVYFFRVAEEIQSEQNYRQN